MSNQSFIPFSSQLGIAGTSYRLQMGRVNDKWASRILKGQDVIESYVYADEKDIPNSNLIVGWCLKVIAIPNINPYQIMKTVQFLIKETTRNWEENKSKIAAPVEEAIEARENLEVVPEEERTRRREVGWVKEEEAMGEGAVEGEEPAPIEAKPPKKTAKPAGKASKAAKAAVAPSEEGEERTPITDEDKSRIRSRLPAIPTAEGGEEEAPAPAKHAKPAPAKAKAKAPAAAAKASGGASGVIKCKNCGFEIKFCPNCGEQL
jgi:hypothetical protein